MKSRAFMFFYCSSLHLPVKLFCYFLIFDAGSAQLMRRGDSIWRPERKLRPMLSAQNRGTTKQETS